MYLHSPGEENGHRTPRDPPRGSQMTLLGSVTSLCLKFGLILFEGIIMACDDDLSGNLRSSRHYATVFKVPVSSFQIHSARIKEKSHSTFHLFKMGSAKAY